MRLLSRVIRLESKVKTAAKPVHVFFPGDGLEEKALTNKKNKNYDPNVVYIKVDFVNPAKNVGGNINTLKI